MKTRREFVKLVGGAALGTGVLLAGRGSAGAQAKAAKGVPSEPVRGAGFTSPSKKNLPLRD